MNDLYLWQLISPTIPIGAYAYSQGLESAVENKLITTEEESFEWISGILLNSIGKLEAPVYLRLLKAWQSHEDNKLLYWHQFLQASRESSEFLAEDQQLGTALLRLLKSLNEKDNDKFIANVQRINHQKPSYLLIYCLAIMTWDIDADKGLHGFLWAWCENQVAAAIKLVPLGQTSGQKLLMRLMPIIKEVTHQAHSISDEEIGSLSVGLSMLSANHEQQYSRLFRS